MTLDLNELTNLHLFTEANIPRAMFTVFYLFCEVIWNYIIHPVQD